MQRKGEGTHEFELRLSTAGHSNRLDTLLTRLCVIEPQKSLMRLNALIIPLLRDSKRELEYIVLP